MRHLISLFLILAISSYCYSQNDPKKTFEEDGILYTVNDNQSTVELSAVNTIPEEVFIVPGLVNHEGYAYLVTSIGWEGCKEIPSKTVIIPSSIEEIGDFSFYNCKNLTSISFGNNVRRIGYDAFSKCTNLLEIEIPSSLTSIDTGAFLGCSSLNKVVLGENVQTIEAWAFYDCISLSEIVCYAVNAPWCNVHCFDYVDNGLKLTVPCGSSDSYKMDSQWSRFYNISEMEDNPEKLFFNETLTHLCIGDEHNLNLRNNTSYPNSEIAWKSDNQNVCTVNRGYLCAIGEGTAEITATAPNGISANITIYVRIPATCVSIENSSIKINKGDTYRLRAKIEPENATYKYVYWSSNDSSIATVSNEIMGEVTVTGIQIGKTTLTAKSADTAYWGASEENIATCEIEVLIPTVKLTCEIPGHATIKFDVVKNECANVNVIPEDGWILYKATFDGNDVTEDFTGNLFITPPMEYDSTLNVIFQSLPSNVEKPNNSNVNLTIEGSGIRLTTDNGNGIEVTIYTFEGQNVYQFSNKYISTLHVPLNTGLYIIECNGKIYKTIIR